MAEGKGAEGRRECVVRWRSKDAEIYVYYTVRTSTYTGIRVYTEKRLEMEGDNGRVWLDGAGAARSQTGCGKQALYGRADWRA